MSDGQEIERLVAERTAKLMAEKLKAERDSMTKTAFLANMSHELRTPLTSIQMYTELVRDEILAGIIEPKRQAQDLDTVLQAGEHLLSLIEDVLDVTKVESGRMGMFLEDTPLRQLLDEVVAQATPLTEKNGNDFILLFTNIEQLVIQTDSTRLKQILLNLLSNASKFTTAGTITFSVWLDEMIKFSVGDTGIGMTDAQTQIVWREFEQADLSTFKKYGGTGLGLALTRKLVGILLGKISLETKPGVGSVFTVSLPTTYPTSYGKE